MTDEERDAWSAVHYRMDDEGMWYCFEHYSSFQEIKDPEFHRRREEFLRAGRSLREYIEAKNEEANEY